MKKIKIIITLAVFCLTAETVLGDGGLNEYEQAIMVFLESSYTLDEKVYVVDPIYRSAARKYLESDGVDLTEEQYNSALAEINTYLAYGVENGYLILYEDFINPTETQRADSESAEGNPLEQSTQTAEQLVERLTELSIEEIKEKLEELPKEVATKEEQTKEIQTKEIQTEEIQIKEIQTEKAQTELAVEIVTEESVESSTIEIQTPISTPDLIEKTTITLVEETAGEAQKKASETIIQEENSDDAIKLQVEIVGREILTELEKLPNWKSQITGMGIFGILFFLAGMVCVVLGGLFHHHSRQREQLDE